LTKELRQRVLEHRVLSIFGPVRGEVAEEWRKLREEELNDLYPSSNIIRVIKSRIRRVGQVARVVEGRGTYRVLVRQREGKRTWETQA
jgi:hypothetical protein